MKLRLKNDTLSPNDIFELSVATIFVQYIYLFLYIALLISRGPRYGYRDTVMLAFADNGSLKLESELTSRSVMVMILRLG
jgi:hypothetical protein